MRRRSRLGTLIGCAFVAATFALISPGVRIARAQDAASSAHESREPRQSVEPLPLNSGLNPGSSALAGPTCRARTDPPSGAQLNSLLAQARRELVAKQGSAGPEIRVLNARGYNYGSDGIRVDPRKLQLEADRQP
jgi:hypothetical protein